MAESLDDGVRWRHDERALWRAAPGGAVIVLGAHDTDPRALTGSGAALWLELANPSTVGEISAALGERFSVDAHDVRESIEPVIVELTAVGALRRIT